MGRLPNEEPQKESDLFQFLNSMLQQVEESNGGPELELRSKIEALRTETQKVPEASSSGTLNEAEVNSNLEFLSAKLAKVQSMIAEVESDPDAKSFLQESASLWMPLITANADERRAASSTPPDSQSPPRST
ncbi:hypothetical protein R1sor_001925 [Riccia sorocarpa]|uniref:Uncharacterized protein n=1 Tax=Riccia sorocarpa TaxID=122646 RepID=A0ABD3GY66_9MARC